MKHSSKSIRNILNAYFFILPAFAIYFYFILLPIFQTFRISFYDWDGLTQPNFIGINNFIELTKDPILHQALLNNFLFMAFYTIIPISIALLLTELLTKSHVKGFSFFRASFFLPQVMAIVAVGIVWKWIYNPTNGPLNQMLEVVGLHSLVRPWLGDFNFALPAVGLAAAWVQYGFSMILFIAGVQHIDPSLYEAAKIDGANEFRQFIHVTLPGLQNEIIVSMVTSVIAALRIFDLVYVTTKGSPGMKTMVTSLWLYRNAFQINRVGYASSMAVLLTLLIIAFSLLLLSLGSKR